MDHESIQSEPQPQADNPWLKEGLFNDVDNAFNPERKASVELPTSSGDFVCDCYLKEIAHMGKMGELTDFVNEALSTSPREYASPEEFLNANPGYVESVHQMSEQDKAALREYTGPDYTFINSLARGFWEYEKMGRQDDETEKRFLSKINDIHQAITNAPAPAEDYITYRGTNMREFTGYDLGSISNLKNLEGQFFVEKGFMSTSLTKEHSYTEQDLSGTLHDKCDIEIRYHIPAGNHDSAALLSSEVSDIVAQQEVVINNYTLNYISKVSETSDGGAVVDMLMIPREFYEG